MRNKLVTIAISCVSMAASGQSIGSVNPSDVPKPMSWDVSSVRQADASCPHGSGINGMADGVRVYCATALFAIEFAYGIREPSRIVGAPEWVKSGPKWNIDAKVSGQDAAVFTKLNWQDKYRMLRPLLEERFALKAHMEKREIPVYDLVVAKSGSKLKMAAAEEAAKSYMRSQDEGKIDSVSMSLTAMLPMLNSEVGRPVVDKTGLTGKYDFTLDFMPTAKAGAEEMGRPSIFTAIEEQLGLKLEPTKEPMDVLVIDSIEQPTAN
jgi:uncharacterized protein (TIGR03435 family)